MASSGKKGKIKWKAVDPSQIINPTTRKITSSSWADETNDPDDVFDFGRKTEVTLPTAPRAARGAENDAKVPHEPPFQAYLSNVSYEVTEDDLKDFFSALRVKGVRLPRDDRGNTSRAKGFGYVEFEDRNSLIEALSMPDTNCKNRRMRIDVAEGDQGRGGRGGNRDRGPNEPDRTMGDWRSGPRQEADSSSDRDGYRSGPRREYNSDRGGMYGDRDRRGGGGFRDDERDRGGFRDRPGFRDNRGGFDRGGSGFRDDRGGGGFRDGGGDRYERRNYDDRRGGGFEDRRSDYGSGSGDNKGTWRRDPEPPRERDPGPPPDRNEPKTRTKLNLQPRSRPVEEKVNGNEAPVIAPTAAAPPAPAATAASIFGGARPVDTAAREREIEERLAKQREDRPTPRDENKQPASSQPRLTSARDPPDPPSSPPLEPAPPPKENVWTRRQQTTPQTNNGSISPHENGDMHKNKNPPMSNESRKYQPPQRNAQEDGGPPRGSNTRGAGSRHIESKPPQPSKNREQKKEISDEMIKMPKVQEHEAPNFVGSNKYAFLEDSESAAD